MTQVIEKTEQEQEKVYAELQRIISLAEDKVDEKVLLDLSQYRVVDQMPQGLPLMEDVIRDYISGEKYLGGETILVLARVGDIYGDPTYNRVEEINYNNCAKQIRNVGGYSYAAADVLSAYLRPTARVVSTKGNHRITMNWLVLRDPNARTPVALKLHHRNATLAEMVVIEAQDHTRDCSYRTPQKGDDKFKSNYYANEPWAVDLYNDCAKYSIGIAGTNPNAVFDLPRYSYLSRATKEYGAVFVDKFLKAFTENKCSDVIGGNIVIAGTSFCKHFRQTIDDIDSKYNVDSFSDMLQFYFHEWGKLMASIDEPGNNVTQEQITDAAAWNNPKGQEPGVARFVFMYNSYCARKKYNLKGTANTVIPFESDSKTNEWNVFLETCHEYIRPSIYTVAKTRFF